MIQETTHPLELALKSAGYDLHHWPLITTQGPQDETALMQAWSGIERHQAVMFVSPQAVHHFFLRRPHWVTPSFECWATGPGSREALIRVGVDSSRIQIPDESVGIWDTDQLWLKVQHRVQVGSSVLIVRGGQAWPGSVDDALGAPARVSECVDAGVGRAYLGQQLRAHGVQVEFVVAYVRSCPKWSDAQTAQARAALLDKSVWLFSSSQAVQHLASLLPDGEYRAAQALATHERIAKELEKLGFGVVVRSRQHTEDLLASLKSMQ
jgi:uroporphyrinogen-III synthase